MVFNAAPKKKRNISLGHRRVDTSPAANCLRAECAAETEHQGRTGRAALADVLCSQSPTSFSRMTAKRVVECTGRRPCVRTICNNPCAFTLYRRLRGRVVFLNAPAEGRPVVGHRLREFKQLGGQVLGAAKCDPQFPGPQRNAGGKILEEALAYIHRSRSSSR